MSLNEYDTHLFRVLSDFNRRELGDLVRIDIGLLPERSGGDLARLGDSLRTRGGGDNDERRAADLFRRNGDLERRRGDRAGRLFGGDLPRRPRGEIEAR